MKPTMTVAVALGILATPLVAQAPTPGPGAEQARIGYFAGTWTVEGEVQASPAGPGGKYEETETCDWFAGGFHLVCRAEGSGPMGPTKSHSIMGYDSSQGTYTTYVVTNMGLGFLVPGGVTGEVWTWNMEITVEGMLVELRVKVTEESPTSYTTRMEMSFDGSPWMLYQEGKATKVR